MKILGIALLLGATSSWAATVSLPSMDLFATSTVSASQSLSLGDIVGALFVGCFTYFTVVLPFILGVLSTSEKLFKSGQNNGGNASGGTTIIKLALTPIFWLVGGIVIFAIIHIFLEIFYNIDLYSWIKMFLEVRYDSAVNNLSATGTSLTAAKSALLVLDISSRIAFWSIPVIFGVLFVFLFLYIISIFLESSGDDSGFKKAFSATVAGCVALVIVMMYENSVSRVVFKGSPTISPVGSVSTARGAFSSSLKYWIRTGLTNGAN